MNKMNKRIRIHNKILSLKKGLKNISLKKLKNISLMEENTNFLLCGRGGS